MHSCQSCDTKAEAYKQTDGESLTDDDGVCGWYHRVVVEHDVCQEVSGRSGLQSEVVAVR